MKKKSTKDKTNQKTIDRNFPVVDENGRQVEKIELNSTVFDTTINRHAIYQVVRMYLANKRQGTVNTKTRNEVHGGGKKPWRQKGTGRARVGTIRSPLWRTGGVVFGPKQRDYSYSLPTRIKKLALKSSLNDKFIDKKIVIIDKIIMQEAKAKKARQLLSKLKINNRCLVGIDKAADKNILLSFRNLPGVSVKSAQDINALDVLHAKQLVLSKDSLEILYKRLKKI